MPAAEEAEEEGEDSTTEAEEAEEEVGTLIVPAQTTPRHPRVQNHSRVYRKT
jgi:hypothetical protein